MTVEKCNQILNTLDNMTLQGAGNMDKLLGVYLAVQTERDAQAKLEATLKDANKDQVSEK